MRGSGGGLGPLSERRMARACRSQEWRAKDYELSFCCDRRRRRDEARCEVLGAGRDETSGDGVVTADTRSLWRTEGNS